MEKCQNTVEELKKLGYIEKPTGSFKKGQKYYVVDKNLPNCVNSIVCNETMEKGMPDLSFNGSTRDESGKLIRKINKDNICHSYDVQTKTNTGEKKQLKDITNEYNSEGINTKYKTGIYTKRQKYIYSLPDEDGIFYRDCPIWGCKSGTSAIDVIGPKGGKKTRRNKRRKLRRHTRK